MSGARESATRMRRRVDVVVMSLGNVQRTLDRLADEGPRALTIANEWAGPLKANRTDGGPRGSDTSNPTMDAVIAGLPPEVLLAQHLFDDLGALEAEIERLVTASAALVAAGITAVGHLNGCRLATTITDEERRQVADINRRDGECPTCEHTWALGKGDDRLRLITVDAGESHLMCNPCRVAWAHRPVTELGGLEDYPAFTKRRIEQGRKATR